MTKPVSSILRFTEEYRLLLLDKQIRPAVAPLPKIEERTADLKPRGLRYGTLAIAAWLILGAVAHAQDNYEIQVYSYDTVEPGHTMVELHSNFTAEGSTTTSPEGTLPTNHAEHETIEITHGFTPWFETGFYIFTSLRNGDGWDWVGDHIRPRFRVPESWHWPVGVSISNEIGYQRRAFSPDTWTWEIRPIIDKKMGRWYWSINPSFDRSFNGPSVNKGLVL